jgi:hypothetical protein
MRLSGTALLLTESLAVDLGTSHGREGVMRNGGPQAWTSRAQ